MKKAVAIVLLCLCYVMVLASVGCETVGDTTSTIPGEAATTTVSEATTTTVAAATTTSGAGTVAAPTTTKASSAVGALPAPTPKNKVLKGTWSWEVDGDVDGGGADADLWYQIVSEVEHYLVPQNGAGLTIIVGKSFDAVSRSDLQAASYSSDRLTTEGVDDPDVVGVGALIALRTNTGQYAKIEVTGFEAQTLSDGTVLQRYNVKLRYVLYPR